MRLDRPVFKDNLVGALFGAANLFGRKALCLKVDGAALFAHVERYGRQLEQLHEGRREHMLPRVLLQVVSPPLDIDKAAHAHRVFDGRRRCTARACSSSGAGSITCNTSPLASSSSTSLTRNLGRSG